jgi:uncharacterized protein YeaO (DUF488 family)
MSATAHPVRVARVYEPIAAVDGVMYQRVLVDRLWPRGISRAHAQLDDWLPQVAPSTELRRWYGHAPERQVEFRARYLREFDDPTRGAALITLREQVHRSPLLLLTATTDVRLSHACMLADLLSAPDR